MSTSSTNSRGLRRFPGSGWALIAAGVLLAAINLILTPRLEAYGSFPELAGSSVFLTRQLLASAIALLSLYGALGVYERRADTGGGFLQLGFVLAFLGGAALIPLEWGQAFTVHELARVAPEGLEALENQPGPNLFDIGAAVSAGLFALGWIVFAVALLRTHGMSRYGPALVLGGLLASPALAAIVGPIRGQIVGSVAVGAGWVLLGLDVRTNG
jgi:hypothetical protein